jgi:hypothetical protein
MKEVYGSPNSRFSNGQSRVANAQNRHTNTTLPNAQPKMADAIFGFGLSHASKRSLGLDRKNTVVGKFSRKAATVYNERFGAMAGVARWIVLRNSKLSGSWQVCESPPSPSRHPVRGNAGTMRREVGERNRKLNVKRNINSPKGHKI